MAIVIDGITVVVRNSALERRFPGGVTGFTVQATNGTCRSDGTLSGVSFMVAADARVFASALSKHGLCDPSAASSDDIAIVDERDGLLEPCPWLDVDLKTISWSDGKLYGATVAWARGEEPARCVAWSEWKPQSLEPISHDDLERHYELVEVERDRERGGVVIAYAHRETGRTIYVGRPASPEIKELQVRFTTLRRDLAQLMEMPPSAERRAAAVTLCKRATEFVEATSGTQPDPLLCAGIAARLAGQWREAEALFRKVTDLQPELVEGWLELTWALASLGRLNDAETAARRGVALREDPATLGNLAAALVQNGDAEAALPIIDRALALDPSDTVNQTIRNQVRDVLDERTARQDTDLPWYKRWLR